MIPSIALQLLVVISSDWNAVEGTLFRYQRSNQTLPWECCGSPVPVTLGRTGMAWGSGVCDFTDQESSPHKKEGDGKSPAGLFFLGPAFGDVGHQSFAKNIPFLPIVADLECVDDPSSRYYNQFVMTDSIVEPDWKSSEKMREIGPVYALGLVVQHNVDPVTPGKGSAIFMHIGEGKGTAGCTAMAKTDLEQVVAWLDGEQYPCLVQLPIDTYRDKKSEWGLPEVSL